MTAILNPESMGAAPAEAPLSIVAAEGAIFGGLASESNYRPIIDDTEVRARRIHAQVFLDQGYIHPEDIDAHGFMTSEVDPYTDRSRYFLSDKNDGTAVVRQISPNNEGILSLPTLSDFAINPEALRTTADVKRLGTLKPSEVVEISGLAAEKGAPNKTVNVPATIDLYTKMLRHSVEKGHKLWVMGVDRRVTRILNGLLGEGLFKKAGESMHYMGSQTDPMCVNPQEVVQHFLQFLSPLSSDNPKKVHYARALKNALQDIDVSQTDPETKQALLRAGVTTVPAVKPQKDGRVANILRANKGKTAALGVLSAYTVARALPLGTIDEFNGDPAAFFAIDLATVPPYVYGLSMMYGKYNKDGTEATNTKKAAGGLIASASFVAPYAYLYANGEEYPGYVNGIVGGCIAYGIAKAVLDRKKELSATSREQAIDDMLRSKPMTS